MSQYRLVRQNLPFATSFAKKFVFPFENCDCLPRHRLLLDRFTANQPHFLEVGRFPIAPKFFYTARNAKKIFDLE